MYATSAGFAAAVAGSHQASVKCEVLLSGTVLTTLEPSGTGAGIVDGEVAQDRTAAIRTQARLTLADPDGVITPRSASDPLQPYGQEIRPYRGVMVGGAMEWVPLGTLPIIGAARKDDGTYTITVDAHDRASVVARRRSTSGAYSIASGTTFLAAISGIVTSRLPGTQVLADLDTTTTPALLYDETEDLWAAAQDLARAIGFECYFDRLGNLVLRKIRDTTTDAPVVSFVEGANLIEVEAATTNTETYSRVIVTGEGTSGTAAVRGVAVDSDSASPTFYQGPFGDVPKFVRSPLVTSSGQANVVAEGILRRVKGLSEAVEAQVLPDPRVDVGDVATITRERAAVDAPYVLDTVRHGLAPNTPTTVSARRRAA